MFSDLGARVSLCDKKESIDDFPKYKDMLIEKNIELHLGKDYLKDIDADIIFRTPGMYYNSPELEEYKKKNIVITSEMEVFFELCPSYIFAITGSDGKTTTTTLISEFLKEDGRRVYKGGNIGKALLPDVSEMTENDAAVVELSSFQLISMRKSPDTAVITNIAPNHLDVHKDMAEYVDSKKNLLYHQSPFSTAVLNYDNEETRKLESLVRGRKLWFSRKEKVPFGSYLDGENYLCYTDGKTETRLFKAEDIRIPGVHNIENYLAAIAASFDKIKDKSVFKKVAVSFGGVEHRIEFLRELDGVCYYNDSIASSPTRTIAGLNAFSKKVILIAGGYDMKIPYTPLGSKINEKVKLLILDGPTSVPIEEAVLNDNSPEKPEIIHSDSMEMSVKIAREKAEKGDIIILSPASASFDKYKNFEERGNIFKEIVRNLK
jgi:UDP-N-acetylmuramoylalanine--D-glutamate ligase